MVIIARALYFLIITVEAPLQTLQHITDIVASLQTPQHNIDIAASTQISHTRYSKALAMIGGQVGWFSEDREPA